MTLPKSPRRVAPKTQPSDLILWRGLLYVEAARLVAWTLRLLRAPILRRLAPRVLVLVGLLMQIILLLVAGYLIDLSVSLMDLWADLARKHLEITL